MEKPTRGTARWLAGIAATGAILAAVGLYLVVSPKPVHPGYAMPSTVPFSQASPSDLAPSTIPKSVLLPVPYTDQAPLGNWAARQHTCEEASLVMVDKYLSGDHSGGVLDARIADLAINRISSWKPSLDMTPRQVGELAKIHLGWAYSIIPASPGAMDEQLALGRPLIVGVRTHGLGNPQYPGYATHFEQPGWSVSHYLVVVGYDPSGSFILNDPGITRGHGYHITFAQLMHAIDDLDRAYPNLDAGRVFLVLAPPAAA